VIKRMSRMLVLAAVAIPALAFGEVWMIDPNHSSVAFSVKHNVVATVRGVFGKVSGQLDIDDKDPTKSTVEATIDTNSIDTGVEDRDKHLKSADFLDVEKYPQMTFKSTKVEKAGNDKLKVTGDLTLHGVTKPVVLEVQGPTKAVRGPFGFDVRAVSATTKINRQEFGLKWSKLIEAGPVVGDTVNVQLDLELAHKSQFEKAQQQAAAEKKAAEGKK
jgi:polyisoprenoid-binding protein YceI